MEFVLLLVRMNGYSISIVSALLCGTGRDALFSAISLDARKMFQNVAFVYVFLSENFHENNVARSDISIGHCRGHVCLPKETKIH